MKKNEKRFETIILSREENIATITLNRPEKLNALSPQMFQDLTDAFDELARDDTVRVVVMTGEGRAFCSGGDVQLDVAAISDMSPFEWREYMRGQHALMMKIAQIEKPVIASINGIAYGGGCDLALASDIRIASEKARLGQAYIRMGIAPDLGGAYFLPRLVGSGRAKLLIFTGDLINAGEAERIGLVDKVVPPEELATTVGDLAKRLSTGPTKAIAMAKIAINRSFNMDLESALDYVGNLNFSLLQTDDYREGFKAFLEKREPVFQGK